ncbi:MAG: tRNA (adenosine(37)-N6)-threonylcarbamoyltransferase complex ATPase subunit type 1 TsaE [Shewanella sp.]|uniref:tRNA (adenosine(37)-N6)-threonylcarbamoyltransferase complex ATPase subunit type 1 TsaE n=1 Tax=Shewanella sp. SNU WT4 TaxID=2590015 RepID=UPI00112E01B9|nr:tRNA (adenosine(37)-N6)-threonylcarbamoyltransferase complex ATPase subunit type 1 TsaE [Shewanella sp. SNU WT4]QDF66067.1 tRNA (adenosine(37)-N6)-threonylcarbamoyltransferase complex ATPase subunit type 1 TsaE [Shewanella sp. SNU WT4]
MDPKTIFLNDDTETVAFGQKMAALLTPPLTLYLTGDLGAGKTTLSRGIIQSLGHKGAVKSPTYTLVEPYELADIDVYHFDLYRLADPEELEYMGIRDYFSDRSLCIVEWPEQGAGLLPDADLHLHLAYDGDSRLLTINAGSELGKSLLEKL